MKNKDLEKRFLELINKNLTHHEIANQLKKEGFVTKQKKPIDRKWVTTNAWLLRRSGAPVPRANRGPAPTTASWEKSSGVMGLIKAVLISELLSDTQKVRVLRAGLDV